MLVEEPQQEAVVGEEEAPDTVAPPSASRGYVPFTAIMEDPRWTKLEPAQKAETVDRWVKGLKDYGAAQGWAGEAFNADVDARVAALRTQVLGGDISVPGQFARGTAKSFISTVGNTIAGLGRLTEDDVQDTEQGPPQPAYVPPNDGVPHLDLSKTGPDTSIATDIGKAITGGGEAIKTDPEMDKSFWLGDVPNALGSAGAFAATGIVGGPAATGLAGTSLQINSAYETVARQAAKARAEGNEAKALELENKLQEQMLVQAPIGALEVVGVGGAPVRWLKNTPVGQAVQKGVGRVLFGMGREGTQEAVQGALEDTALLHGGIDPTASPLDIAKRAREFAAGAVVGGPLEMVSATVDGKRDAKTYQILKTYFQSQLAAIDAHPATAAKFKATARENLLSNIEDPEMRSEIRAEYDAAKAAVPVKAAAATATKSPATAKTAAAIATEQEDADIEASMKRDQAAALKAQAELEAEALDAEAAAAVEEPTDPVEKQAPPEDPEEVEPATPVASAPLPIDIQIARTQTMIDNWKERNPAGAAELQKDLDKLIAQRDAAPAPVAPAVPVVESEAAPVAPVRTETINGLTYELFPNGMLQITDAKGGLVNRKVNATPEEFEAKIAIARPVAEPAAAPEVQPGIAAALATFDNLQPDTTPVLPVDRSPFLAPADTDVRSEDDSFVHTDGVKYEGTKLTDPVTGATLSYSISKNLAGEPEYIRIGRADTPEASRRQGGATKLLAELQRIAQEQGLPIHSGFANEESAALLQKAGFRKAKDIYDIPLAERGRTPASAEAMREENTSFVWDLPVASAPAAPVIEPAPAPVPAAPAPAEPAEPAPTREFEDPARQLFIDSHFGNPANAAHLRSVARRAIEKSSLSLDPDELLTEVWLSAATRPSMVDPETVDQAIWSIAHDMGEAQRLREGKEPVILDSEAPPPLKAQMPPDQETAAPDEAAIAAEAPASAVPMLTEFRATLTDPEEIKSLDRLELRHKRSIAGEAIGLRAPTKGEIAIKAKLRDFVVAQTTEPTDADRTAAIDEAYAAQIKVGGISPAQYREFKERIEEAETRAELKQVVTEIREAGSGIPRAAFAQMPVTPERLLHVRLKYDFGEGLGPVLNKIIEHTKDPALKAVAEILTKLANLRMPTLMNSTLFSEGYDGRIGDGRIQINPFMSDHRIEQVVLHEAWHHVTLGMVDQYLNNDARLSPEAYQAIHSLELLRQQALKFAPKAVQKVQSIGGGIEVETEFGKIDPKYWHLYGLSSLPEFIADMAVNKKFQAFLKSHEAKIPGSLGGKLATLWEHAVEYMRKIFGAQPGDMLHQGLRHLMELAQESGARIDTSGKYYGKIAAEPKLPAGDGWLFSLAPYDSDSGLLGGKHTLPKSGNLMESVFQKIGGTGGREIPKAEVDLYRLLVPEAFKDQRVNVPVLQEGLRTKGPVVETKTLPQRNINALPRGEDADVAERDTILITGQVQLEHQLDTVDPQWRTAVEMQNLGVNGIPHYVIRDGEVMADRRLLQPLLDDYNHLQDERAHNDPELGNLMNPGSDAGYSWLGPKPESDMPGYVEMLVRVPLKDTRKARELTNEVRSRGEIPKRDEINDQRGLKYTGPHFGSEDTNVLAFFRGYEETLPDGSKAFHVIEVQSDWAQRQRDVLEATKRMEANPDQVPDHAEHRAGYEAANHPLLKVYESLALKAAIKHAKEVGATKVILSDGETAMMTEGHDRVAVWRQRATKEAKQAAQKVLADADRSSNDNSTLLSEARGIVNAKLDEIVPSYLLEPHGAGDASGTPYHKVLVEAGLAPFKEPSQDKGMRLHYDQTLPSAMEKLTGMKGEAVELGEHKAAQEERAKLPRWGIHERPVDPSVGGPFLVTENNVGSRRFDTREDAEQYVKTQKEFLEDGIGSQVFHDAAGKPKTQITGRVYDISNTPGAFTLTRRYAAKPEANPVILDMLEAKAKLLEQAALTREAEQKLATRKGAKDLKSPDLANLIHNFYTKPDPALRGLAEVLHEDGGLSETSAEALERSIARAMTKAAPDPGASSAGLLGALPVNPYRPKALAQDIPTASVPSASDPAVEARWKGAKLHKKTWWERARNSFTHGVHAFRRHFIELDPETDGASMDILRRAESIPDRAKYMAGTAIRMVTDGLGPNKYEVFNRVLILRDLQKDITRGLYTGKDLPFGYADEAAVADDLNKFETAAAKSSDIVDAIAKRQKMIHAVRDELVKRNLLHKKVQDFDDYFHRQVLEYYNLQDSVTPGAGRKDARVGSRGYQRKRKGSAGDFNTSYIEAEFEVLSQAYSQIEMQKAIQQLRSVADITPQLKAQAKNLGVDWETLIPKAEYTLWQPEKGNFFYKGNTLADKVLEEFLKGTGILEAKDFHKAPMLGGRRQEWVIPRRLAKTLESLGPTPDSMAAKLAAAGTSSWKQWILLNPPHVLKYNLNNLSGDLDIVMAYNPKILKEATDAFRDANRVRRGRQNIPDLEDLRRLDVIGSGFSVQEVPDIGNQDWAKVLRGEQPNLLQRYWKNTKDFTEMRENFLRIAAYRHFLKEINAGKRVYGASNQAEINAVTDPKERAAKLARELIGDYGNISVNGQYIRSHMIPFYSWMEINAPRYARLMRNLPDEGRSTSGAVAAMSGQAIRKTLTKGLSLGIKATTMYMVVNLWNKAFFPDEEEEMSDADRGQLHLILGRTKEGKIRSLRFQGALSDALSWFGAENLPQDIAEIRNGKSTVMEKIWDAVKAPWNKLGTGAVPILKSIAETASATTFYPDVFNPRPVRDRVEHAARALSVDSIYKRLAGKPTASAAQDMAGLLTYTTDPGEAAYYAARGLVQDYMEKQGVETPSMKPTAKSNALYYYKQALRYGDEEIADKYLQKFYELGGDIDGLQSSIDKSAPMQGLIWKGRDRQSEFMRSLSAEDQAVVKRAVTWHNRVYRNITPPPPKK